METCDNARRVAVMAWQKEAEDLSVWWNFSGLVKLNGIGRE